MGQHTTFTLLTISAFFFFRFSLNFLVKIFRKYLENNQQPVKENLDMTGLISGHQAGTSKPFPKW